MKRIELVKKFAYSNNKVKQGDIVTDHIGSIKVERVRVHQGLNIICCIYDGVMLKKDLTPVKKLTKRSVYQSNLVTE